MKGVGKWRKDVKAAARNPKKLQVNEKKAAVVVH
jgi:hypothetical protein